MKHFKTTSAFFKNRVRPILQINERENSTIASHAATYVLVLFCIKSFKLSDQNDKTLMECNLRYNYRVAPEVESIFSLVLRKTHHCFYVLRIPAGRVPSNSRDLLMIS